MYIMEEVHFIIIFIFMQHNTYIDVFLLGINGILLNLFESI